MAYLALQHPQSGSGNNHSISEVIDIYLLLISLFSYTVSQATTDLNRSIQDSLTSAWRYQSGLA